MKNSILFLVLLQSLLILAQAPQKMTYQSVVRNSANALVSNQAVGVRLSLLEGSLSGTTVYSETQTVTTNANGLFTLEAGGGTPTQGVFADIVWGNGTHYLKSEIDPTGGTNYALSSTKELLSVPYALNGITTAQADAIISQADAITSQASAIAAMQEQIADLQASISIVGTVIIGDQTWTTKNLDVATYSNGDIIPEVQDATAWDGLTTGAWCYYNNDTSNGTTYGKLYNWYAVNDPRGLAPSGFHVPTDAEWTTLTTFLGDLDLAGGKMKSTMLWDSPNEGATNSSGFTGLPGGYRHNYGPFTDIGGYGLWWSTSEYTTARAWIRYLNFGNVEAFRYNDNKKQGYSVRCLKD